MGVSRRENVATSYFSVAERVGFEAAYSPSVKWNLGSTVAPLSHALPSSSVVNCENASSFRCRNVDIDVGA